MMPAAVYAFWLHRANSTGATEFAEMVIHACVSYPGTGLLSQGSDYLR